MRIFGYVHHDFLVSAEARYKAEHENAQTLRHALVREQERGDNERAERLAQLDASERRFQVLLQAMIEHHLKAPLPIPIPAIEREPQSAAEAAIAKTIREQSDGDLARAKELRKYVRELKAEGKNADEIVGLLVATWSTESVAPLG